MRHAKDGYKLRRNPAHRRALLRNLTASVVEKNRVTTTLAKAKAVQPIVEKMIGLGKAGTLADKRRAQTEQLDELATLQKQMHEKFSASSAEYKRLTAQVVRLREEVRQAEIAAQRGLQAGLNR